MIDVKIIKLVIWDLDDTFWRGTLSEGPITPIQGNIDLVKQLTDRGIVNSICSKNDYSSASLMLEELGLEDYFVFKSIDWTPKGQRIASLIKDMGLRPVNVLFIDDNIVNLNEAKFYSPDIMLMDPSEIHLLEGCVESISVSDKEHKRLKQYQILESKQKARSEASDNLDFLYASNTKVLIHDNCLDEFDRIYELIHRTNQLNYTKFRCTEQELRDILNDKEYKSGYVTVSDNFGDYGIVGFFAIHNKRCVHFLFSCRTIGQGVEQWVYSTLGWPDLDVVGDVVNCVEKVKPPQWINQNISSDNRVSPLKYLDGKIIFKGPCDLDILTSFLNTSKLITEFTYISPTRHNSIEHHNHSVNYLSMPFWDKNTQQSLLDECVFNDGGIFKTAMYDDDVALIILSTLPEPNLGIYKRKSDGIRIAFGEWVYDLTDRTNWEYYITHSPYLNTFTEEFLADFSSKYEYEGRQTVNDYLQSIEKLLTLISPKAKLCLMLGVEIPYENNKQRSYFQREIYHKELNARLRELAANNNRIYLIEFGNYVRSQSDFLDNINHFQRNVYYLASIDVNNVIEEVCGYRLRKASKISLCMVKFAGWIGKLFNPQSAVYRFLRKYYRKLRNL